MHRFTLEKYAGTRSRFTCPGCGSKKKFTRYIRVETGTYVDNEVGMCSRVNSCGYHYPPREFFANNPQKRGTIFDRRERRPAKATPPAGFDTIEDQILEKTRGRYEKNNFISFLVERFGIEKVAEAVKEYQVGTWLDGRTVFWQIDTAKLIRTGKLMLYDSNTGKRRKDRTVSWVHAELRRNGYRADPNIDEPRGFRLKQCFFGEHLLGKFPYKPVAVVESEKTAVILSICFPQQIWLATGGCSNLKLDRIARLTGDRRVTLYPDSSKFKDWSEIAAKQMRIAGNFQTSDLLQSKLTDAQREQDIDLADVILDLVAAGKGPRMRE